MASIISAGTTSGTALNLSGDTTGNLAFTTQAGANTIAVPNVTGTIVVSGQNSAITQGTAVASTSGTSIDFTGIPSWVKRITVMFSNTSTNGVSPIMLQLGTSGGIQTTSYSSGASYQGASAAGLTNTTGFIIGAAVAVADSTCGTMTLTSFGSNIWVESGVAATTTTQYTYLSGGSKSLGATLDRVRITTVNGTDAFDAGSINILYE
jgi:hypothetical protein